MHLPASCVHCIHLGIGEPGNGTCESETGWSVCPDHVDTPVTDEVKRTVMTTADVSYRMNINDLPPVDGINSFRTHFDV